MIVDVKFEKEWSEDTLRDWMNDPEDERFEDFSPYDCDELNLLAMIRAEYQDADIATLHKLAQIAMWSTLDLHMSDIMDKIMSLHEVRYDLYKEIEKCKMEE